MPVRCDRCPIRLLQQPRQRTRAHASDISSIPSLPASIRCVNPTLSTGTCSCAGRSTLWFRPGAGTSSTSKPRTSSWTGWASTLKTTPSPSSPQPAWNPPSPSCWWSVSSHRLSCWCQILHCRGVASLRLVADQTAIYFNPAPLM